MSKRTEVPGGKLGHAIITEVCRTNRGDAGAWDEAVRRLRAEYDAALGGWANTPHQMHLVLTVERTPGDT